MKQKDMAGKEITEEYKKLIQEKSALETQKETLTLDIERCRQDMLDSNTIIKTLQNFDKVITALNLEDQKDLITLLIKQITVWSYDPTKEKAPTKKMARAFISKIRTKWYRIKFDLYQFPEIDTYYKSIPKNQPSSEIRKKWLPDVDGSQTPQVQYCQLLVTIHKRRTKRFELQIDKPFPAPTPQEVKMPKNIAQIALEVKAYVELNPDQSNTVVADNFNVTRARISQLLKIVNNLPIDFITKLQDTEDPIMLRRFSGRRLLKLASSKNKEHLKKLIKL